MKKRMISIILAIALLASSAAAMAAETDTQTIPQKVEMAFQAGDRILNINGTDVEVEPPVIVGEGTTLVPLRVITEAFGAKVEWIGETQTIKLSYPDVNITLQIGNKVATVNDHTEMLDEAPILTEDTWVTMVPLRFISETFGATVGYDNATGMITVTKEAVTGNDDTTTIQGTTDKERTGDSFFNWSIKTPQTLTMVDRDGAGLETVFQDAEENLFFILITPLGEKVTYEEVIDQIKQEAQAGTLVKSEDGKDAQGNTYTHIILKTKDLQYNDKIFLVGNNVIQVRAICAVDASDDKKKELDGLVDSFRMETSIGSDTYDLSIIQNGMYEYHNDEYKVKMMIPQFLRFIDSNKTNMFLFMPYEEKYKDYQVSMSVYSKSDTVTAKQCAQEDREMNANSYNPNLAEVSEVRTEDIGGRQVYLYTVSCNETRGAKTIVEDTFTELGDYVYNLTVTYPKDADPKMMNEVLQYHIEKLDAGTVGTLVRERFDDTKTSAKNIEGATFTVSDRWKQAGIKSGVFTSAVTGSMMVISTVKDNRFTKSDLENEFNYRINNVINNNTMKIQLISGSKESFTANGISYKKGVLKMEDDNYVNYMVVYLGTDGKGNIVTVSLTQDETVYGGRDTVTCDEMVKTITLQ